MDWHLLSPFDLPRIIPVGGYLLVLLSLPGPPVVRELTQVVTMVPGQGRRFRSVVPLNSSPLRDFILKILLGNWGRGLFLL